MAMYEYSMWIMKTKSLESQRESKLPSNVRVTHTVKCWGKRVKLIFPSLLRVCFPFRRNSTARNFFTLYSITMQTEISTFSRRPYETKTKTSRLSRCAYGNFVWLWQFTTNDFQWKWKTNTNSHSTHIHRHAHHQSIVERRTTFIKRLDRLCIVPYIFYLIAFFSTANNFKAKLNDCRASHVMPNKLLLVASVHLIIRQKFIYLT